jgi:hypothetical protein
VRCCSSTTPRTPGPEVRRSVGRRQLPTARSVGGSGAGGLADGCLEFSGLWVDGLNGDLVAVALDGTDTVADLAVDVGPLFVVAGAEVSVGGGASPRYWAP